MAVDFKPIQMDIPTKTIEFRPIEEKPSLISRVKKHPFKTLLQPISKTLTGKSLGERTDFLRKRGEVLQEKAIREGKTPSTAEFFIKQLPASIAQTAVNLADLSPADIGIMVATAGVGRIPVRGTTLGKIVKTVPIKKGFGKAVKELGRYERKLKSMKLGKGISPTARELVAEPLDPVKKITKLLKKSKPLRKEQEALYTVERGKRIGEVIKIGETVKGEKGYFAQLKRLKGKLPKVEFEGVRKKVTQNDIDSLFNIVERTKTISPFEKITAKTGLSKLFGAEGGIVPNRGEIKLLEIVFPKDFIKAVASKKNLLSRAGEITAEILNIPRALMASTDMSAPLRQGVFLIGRPKQFSSAFGNMFKYFFKEKAYKGLMNDIRKRPTYDLMTKSKLPLTDIGASLTGREEAFMSTFAEKIPGIGRIVKASNRAYTGFLNKLRADVFDDLVSKASKQGLPVENIAPNIAKFVGAATGRGKLGVLENSAVALNTVFFSPRLMASRLNLLNPAFYVKLDPFTRKETLKSLFTFAGTAATVFGLAKAGGAEIGADPRNADFGKIKVGNTRYDILGGFQQYIRAASQMITGVHISSTTGVKTTLGEGYKPVTRFDIATRFLESKEAPIASFVTMLVKGKTFLGKKPKISKEIGLRFTPMVIQDMYDLYKERGIEGIAMSTPAIFGTGVQTYFPDAAQMVYSANSVLSNYKKLLRQGRIRQAKELLNKNKDIIRIGKTLEGTQKVIKSYEKLKENAEKNIRLSPEDKRQRIDKYNQKIKELQNKMEKQYQMIKKPKIDFKPIKEL